MDLGSSHSHGQGKLGEEERGEDAGDEVDAVVVQHHLPGDRDDAFPGNLHYLPSLGIPAGELQAAI